MTLIKTEIMYDPVGGTFNMPDGVYYYTGDISSITKKGGEPNNPAVAGVSAIDEVLKLKAANLTFAQIKELKQLGII